MCNIRHHSGFSYDKIYQSLKRSKGCENKNCQTQSQHLGSSAPEEIKWGCHWVSCSCSHTHTSKEETVSATEFEKTLPHMWNSTTPTQKNSELVQLSALTFQLNSPPPLPSSVPRAAAALTEGLCQFPSDCHSHFCLYYQQCTGAVPAWKGCWSLSLHSSWPCHEPDWERAEPERAGGKGCVLGKGTGREEAGSWEGRE